MAALLDVIKIRKLYKHHKACTELKKPCTLKKLAQRFGVSRVTFTDAALGRTWKHIT
jgi:hypothetical protein